MWSLHAVWAGREKKTQQKKPNKNAIQLLQWCESEIWLFDSARVYGLFFNLFAFASHCNGWWFRVHNYLQMYKLSFTMKTQKPKQNVNLYISIVTDFNVRLMNAKRANHFSSNRMLLLFSDRASFFSSFLFFSFLFNSIGTNAFRTILHYDCRLPTDS